MNEAEEGIKIIEAGITMKEVLLIVLGGALGIAGSIVSYWFERFKKRRDFKNGVKSELIEKLPRMASTVLSLKAKRGELDHKTIQWGIDSFSKRYTREEIKERFPFLDVLLSAEPDTLKKELKINKTHNVGVALELKKFNLIFLENNLDKILLLGIDSQKRLYKIHDKLNVINQAVDRFYFYYHKSFDTASYELNKEPLTENMQSSYNRVSELLIDVVNETIELLEEL